MFKMEYKIHDGNSEDFFILEGSSVEGMRKQARIEVDKRGWKNPWSEEIK